MQNLKPSKMAPSFKGDFIFGKNGEDSITLFDGRQEIQAPKGVLRYLRLVARMSNPDSNRIQIAYEQV